MNRAQAIVNLGDGVLEWRDDILPLPSVLAFELSPERDPVHARALYLEPSKLTEPVKRLRRESISETLAMRMLGVIRTASRSGEKLGFHQICERSHVGRSKHSSRVLRTLCQRGLIVRKGDNRGAVYMAHQEEEQECAES